MLYNAELADSNLKLYMFDDILVHSQTPDFYTSIKETVIKPVRRAFNYIGKGSGDVP